MSYFFKLVIYLSVALLVVLGSCTSTESIAKAKDLKVSEGFSNPLGFYDDEPSFSWRLPNDVNAQSAYTIIVGSSPDLLPDQADLWNSGKIVSSQSLFIQYEGVKLESRQKVFWRIKYWDEDGAESQWSDVAYFELGLLSNRDWTAKWIGLPDAKAENFVEIDRKIHNPQYLRKNVEITKPIQKARLYITAKGLYEAYINGQKVTEDVLAPGWTPYHKRIETLTYDVGGIIEEGENALGLILAEGWHSGRLLFRNYSDKAPQVIAQLEVTYNDGETVVFGTDKSWKATTNGPIRYSSIYDGEFYDANMDMPNWSTPGYQDQSWVSVTEESVSTDMVLSPKQHSTVVTKLTLPTLSISEPVEGVTVFDLGQNMAGVPKIKIPVKKGQRVKIRVAEMLQSNGEIYTDNYRGALSTDYYIPSEDGMISWNPRFTFHGFRYVELSGYDDNATPEKSWVTGLVQYSDFEMPGGFTSSHTKLNQLQSNIEWGLRGNFLDIPTDCPQRNERLGWTGDAQVFAPTSLFVADVHSFWSSWLKSVREDQFDDGGIPVIVPKMTFDRVSSGWGDAITIIPWETYQRTGDVSILEDNYQAMRKWLDYYESKATDRIVSMFTFGDWLQPYSENPGNKNIGETNTQLLSTAYYARSIEITRQVAEVLGLDEDKAELTRRRDDVRRAFQEEFFNSDGSISKGKSTQTGYLMALGFDLLSSDLALKAIPHLLSEIEKADYHLRTGFLGTPLLGPVLEQIGRQDIMFKILFKETYPSWFYSINQGATTMWERWDSYTLEDGFHKAGMNSFNHYAYGAIGQWMYERIAGIQALEPGYKAILIAPLLGGPLTSAEAFHDSPYGMIKSSWKLEGKTFKINTTIPPNTSATIIIPANTNKKLLMNGEEFSESSKMNVLKKSEKGYELDLKPGSYEFTTSID